MSRLTKHDQNGIPMISPNEKDMTNSIKIECTKIEQETILKVIDDADDVCIFENKRPGCWGDCRSCVKHNVQWTIKDEK